MKLRYKIILLTLASLFIAAMCGVFGFKIAMLSILIIVAIIFLLMIGLFFTD